jgi:hypothetical protein
MSSSWPAVGGVKGWFAACRERTERVRLSSDPYILNTHCKADVIHPRCMEHSSWLRLFLGATCATFYGALTLCPHTQTCTRIHTQTHTHSLPLLLPNTHTSHICFNIFVCIKQLIPIQNPIFPNPLGIRLPPI